MLYLKSSRPKSDQTAAGVRMAESKREGTHGSSHPLVKLHHVPPPRPTKIDRIRFGMLSGADMERMSVLKVTSKELYKMSTTEPAPNGCLDPRLGVSSKSEVCATCGNRLAECVGHFGHIKLALPVFHIGYIASTLLVLQCICKTCSRVLVPEAERARYIALLREPVDVAKRKLDVLKLVAARCKRVVRCPRCHAFNGPVKKVAGALTVRVVHDRHRAKAASGAFAAHRAKFARAFTSTKEMDRVLGSQGKTKVLEFLHPLRVLELFRHIPPTDVELLWMPTGSPEKLILTHILVPPACIRPSVRMEGRGGSNEDDLTVKLHEIVDTNNHLTRMRERGAGAWNVIELWDFLQNLAAQYINGALPGFPPALKKNTAAIRGLCQRLKGKQGRFRGNLSGKRVDFSARTVISPDPNLRIDEVGVPNFVAMSLTFPEKVTTFNIERLRRSVINGHEKWPGANYVRLEGRNPLSLKYGDRSKAAASLHIGAVVERHLIDGDIVLFNRQPSLHKLSIMSHRVRVMPHKTFRFNECVCAPYNADFDGDEMNLHVPQTEEARAEAAILMDVTHNLVTPKNGEPLVSACQDFLTAAYLLTQRDVLLDRAAISAFYVYASEGCEHIDLPPPAILKVRLLLMLDIYMIGLSSLTFFFFFSFSPSCCGRGSKPLPRSSPSSPLAATVE